MNKVEISGLVHSGPWLPNGNGPVKFMLSNESLDGKYKDIFTCIAWGDTAGTVAKVSKGDKVSVVGKLKNNSWVDRQTGERKYSVQIVISKVNVEPGSTISDDEFPQ